MASTSEQSICRAGDSEPHDGVLYVSVVICTHNRSDELQRYALPSLAGLSYPNFEVVVIDDASSDDTEATVARFQALMPHLRYVKNEKHHSLCHVRNLGVASSRGEIIAFIDDDCEVDPSWLNELVHPYIDNLKTMAVAGKVFLGNTGQEAKSPVGCNMSFRASLFESFRFDTNLTYSHWGDETDLFEMMRASNIPVLLAPKATVRHHISQSPFRPDKIGWSLNALYSFGKRHFLITYYAALFAFSGMFVYGTVNEHYWVSRHARQFAVGSLVVQLRNNRRFGSPWKRFFWVYYVILIEIPWKLFLWKHFRRTSDRGVGGQRGGTFEILVNGFVDTVDSSIPKSFKRVAKQVVPGIDRKMYQILKLVTRPEPVEVRIKRGELAGRQFCCSLKTERGYWLGNYEEGVVQFLRESLSPGGVFYDIGVHKGYFSLMAAKLVGSQGQVIGFEPNPDNRAMANRNCDLNPDLRSIVTIEPLAIAGSRSTMTFVGNPGSATGKLVAGAKKSDKNTSPDGIIEVQTISIDEYVRAGHPPPQAVKMDIEGAEEFALAGMHDLLSQYRPRVLVEIHTAAAANQLAVLLDQVQYVAQDMEGQPFHSAADFTERGHYILRPLEIAKDSSFRLNPIASSMAKGAAGG